jgi:hypothetical protein
VCVCVRERERERERDSALDEFEQEFVVNSLSKEAASLDSLGSSILLISYSISSQSPDESSVLECAQLLRAILP